METFIKTSGNLGSSHIMFQDKELNLRVIPIAEMKLHLNNNRNPIVGLMNDYRRDFGRRENPNFTVTWNGGSCEITKDCFVALCKTFGMGIPDEYKKDVDNVA